VNIAIWFKENGVLIGSILTIFILIFLFYPHLKFLGFVTGPVGQISQSVGSGPVINLTFDNPDDPWKDYSALDHHLTP